MDVQGGWFGFQKVLTQKGGKVWSGLGLFLVGHTYGWWVGTLQIGWQVDGMMRIEFMLGMRMLFVA